MRFVKIRTTFVKITVTFVKMTVTFLKRRVTFVKITVTTNFVTVLIYDRFKYQSYLLEIFFCGCTSDSVRIEIYSLEYLSSYSTNIKF